MDVGAVEQRASAPRAVVFYLEPLVVLIMAQFVFAVYSRCSQGIYLHSEDGPGPEAKRLATFAVYGQHGPVLAFIVCVC